MKHYDIAGSFANSHRKDMPQTSDYVFRMLYGQDTEESRQALIVILNIVLDRKQDPIKHIVVKNPISLGSTRNKKETVMDIRAETDAGELLDIEMQSGHLTGYPERALFYSGKLLTSTLQSGQDYDKLEKSIVVSLIDGIVFPEVEGCHAVFRLQDRESGHLLSDKLTLHFVELGKVDLAKPVEELQSVERLAAYIKYANEESCAEYIETILVCEEELSMAENLYRKLTQEEIAFEEMETQSRTEFVRKMERYYAKEEGRALGMEEGREEGREEGEEIGKEKGREQIAALMGKLLADNRLEDLKRATEDAQYRAQLVKEYGLEEGEQ